MERSRRGGFGGGGGGGVKVTPNLAWDREGTQMINLSVLRRLDLAVTDILITAAHVVVCSFDKHEREWTRKPVEGSLFVVKRNTQPRFQLIVMNRINTENLVEDLLTNFEVEVQIPYLMYRNAADEIIEIWFYDPQECQEVAHLFSRIEYAYSRASPKANLSSKSVFEEPEATSGPYALPVVEDTLQQSTSPTTDDDDVEEFLLTASKAATFVHATRKVFMLLCSGRLQVSKKRTLAPPGLCHQFLLPIPLMAAINKLPHFWSRLGCWAVLSYVMTITGQGAIIFRGLSSILAQGGFTTRFCGYIVKWFGYEGRLFVRVAEFVDLISTLFRHASSTLKSASDILGMINAFHPNNASSSNIQLESVPLDDESNVPSSQEITTDHTGVQYITVSSISEGRRVISQWKTENAQISVDVPPTMSPETARELKMYFEEECANHLLNGPTINTILEKALLQGSSLPSPSPSTDLS